MALQHTLWLDTLNLQDYGNPMSKSQTAVRVHAHLYEDDLRVLKAIRVKLGVVGASEAIRKAIHSYGRQLKVGK